AGGTDDRDLHPRPRAIPQARDCDIGGQRQEGDIRRFRQGGDVAIAAMPVDLGGAAPDRIGSAAEAALRDVAENGVALFRLIFRDTEDGNRTGVKQRVERAHRPCHRGARFSTKARKPSLRSSLSYGLTPSFSCSAAAIGRPEALIAVSFIRRSVIGALPPIFSASASAALRSSPCGTTRFTRPQRAASSAPIYSPV